MAALRKSKSGMETPRWQIKQLLKQDVIQSLFPNGKAGNKSGSSNIEVKDTETMVFRKVKVSTFKY